MALVDHLRELRRRLTWSLVALAVGIVAAYALWEPIYACSDSRTAVSRA